MIYMEYVRSKRDYEKALKTFIELMDEKTLIFMKTQPSSLNTELERVDGGQPKNKNDEYIIELEETRIDERIEEAKNILSDRNLIMMQILGVLKQSKNKYDRVYYCRWVQGMRTAEIANELAYSESHVYRMVKNIKKNIKMIGNDRK